MRKRLKDNLIRISALFLFLVLCITAIWGGQFIAPTVYADTGKELNYDKTNVLDDLGSSSIDGKPFNLNDYPKTLSEKYRFCRSSNIVMRLPIITTAIMRCICIFIIPLVWTL